MGAKNHFDKKLALDEIISDLKLIIGIDEIMGKEIEELLSEVKSEEVKKYLKSLKGGSKPEGALKDAFFAGANSPLVKYLFGWINPETNVESGFVDYLTDSRGDSKGIAIEIKPLFEARFESGKSGRVLEKIVERKLRWDKYKDQIRKYLGRRGEFVIFTNLKEWYFFSRSYSSDEKCAYFFNTDFEAFIEEYSQIEDLPEYLDRKEQEAIKEVLDKKFFASLRSWINELSEMEFLLGISEREKNELIINLINKFIFIQTLDDFWVIENKWIQIHWDSVERKWQAKGKLKVLEEFFNEEVNKWFYEFYDTELFRGNILDYMEKDERNIDLFYRKLKLVLGIDFGATAIGWVRGIMQYNFRRINEDIFGKAYESYLAELRKEQGIFYTPSYITEYIVENTVGRIFDDILGEIEGELTTENFKEAKKLVEKFTSVKVLDPACGSGSFLIKTLRLIWKKYARLREILGERERVYLKNGISSDELDELNEIKRILGVGKNKDRELISKVIVRHIHGNDLDRRALEVAKVNIWLEAIKLAPKDFRFDLLGETNHILPDLEMNLTCGDSLVGLLEDLTIEVLEEHKEEIVKLWELRKKYLEDTSRGELVDSIERVKNELRGVLYQEFKKYLEENNLPLEILDETKPLHWTLEFWFVFFDEDGEVKLEEEQGFDDVVGNPPYVRIQNLVKVNSHLVKFYNHSYNSATKNYDISALFVEKALSLLNKHGFQSYIISHRFMKADYGEGIRSVLSDKYGVSEILDFDGYLVFPEASINTCILIVRKAPIDKLKYIHVLITRGDKENIEDIIELSKQGGSLRDGRVIIELIDQTRLGPKPWLLSGGERGAIFEKVTAIEPKLEKTSKRIFQGVVTGADKVFILEKRGNPKNGLVKVYSKVTEKEYEFEEEILKPLLRGGEIKRYEIPEWYYYVLFPYKITEEKAHLIPQEEFEKDYPRAWAYLLENKEALENRERRAWKGRDDWYAFGRRQNIEQFEQPKIMTCVLSSVASYTSDKGGIYYFVGGGNAGGYGITLKENLEIPLEYVLGLTNSKLLDFIHHNISVRCYQTAYSYAKRFIKNLPIYPASEEEQKPIIELVYKIINLKRFQNKFIEIWNEWSTKLKNNELSLHQILTSDANLMRTGEFEKTWTSEATFYPDGEHEILSKEYKKFRVVGDSEKPILKVYGLDENNKEEKVYEMEFKDRELMLHVFLSIKHALESKRKIKTLAYLLAKTIVPIIQPDSERNTPNIMRKVREDFGEWVESEKIGHVELDIVKIENEIEDVDAKIDALVFRLYGLDENEVRTVLKSLNVFRSYEEAVLKAIRRKNEQ